jgi:hypothetical protein
MGLFRHCRGSSFLGGPIKQTTSTGHQGGLAWDGITKLSQIAAERKHCLAGWLSETDIDSSCKLGQDVENFHIEFGSTRVLGFRASESCLPSSVRVYLCYLSERNVSFVPAQVHRDNP